MSEWADAHDETLHIGSGSALDMSWTITTAVPAGSNGSIIVMPGDSTKLCESGTPSTEVKFNIATWTASGFVPIPNQAEVTAGVEFLRRCGFNALRLHGPENWLMEGTTGAVNFNGDGVDRLRWLMSECKRLGIYYIINPASYILYLDGAGGSRFAYTSDNNAKPRMFTEQDVRDNWKSGFAMLYCTVNQYTGLTPLNDPACCHVELYNESGVTFCASTEWPVHWMTRTVGSTAAGKTWTEWLADSTMEHGYVSLSALNASWGTSHASFEAIPAPASYYVEGSSYPQTQQGIDAILYGMYLEDDLDAFYAACMADWEYSGLSSFTTLYPQALVARAVGKLTTNKVANTHGYPMLVGSLTPGASFSGGKPNNPIWEASNYNWLFAHPFVCSNKPRWYGEYGWSSWGRYRNQFPIQTAMAAMQGASAISYYAQGNFFGPEYFNDLSTVGGRSRLVYPYHGNSDQVADFVRTLNALIMGGAVAEHAVSQELVLNDRFIGVVPRNTSRIGRALSYLFQPLYFISGFVRASLSYTADTTDDTLAAVWNTSSFKQLLDTLVESGSIDVSNATYASVTANSGSITGFDMTDRANPEITVSGHTLQSGDTIFVPSLTGSGSGWPGTNNKWTPYVATVTATNKFKIPLNTAAWTGTFTEGTWCEGMNVFESATGEFGMSRRDTSAWINTQKLVYYAHIGSPLPATQGSVTVTALTDGGSLFVASLDGLPIATSAHLLIGMCGDSQNTGMTFVEPERETLITGGDYPEQIIDCTASLSLAITRPSEFSLYRVGRGGSRTVAESPLSIDAPTGRLNLSLRTGVVNPSVFFELYRP